MILGQRARSPGERLGRQASLALSFQVLTLLGVDAAFGQAVTTYKYDALGQIISVGRGSTITAYIYDSAGNRVELSSNLNMDPGAAPAGAPARIVVMPLTSGYLLPLPPTGGTARASATLLASPEDASMARRAASLGVSAPGSASSEVPTGLLRGDGKSRVGAAPEPMPVRGEDILTRLGAFSQDAVGAFVRLDTGSQPAAGSLRGEGVIASDPASAPEPRVAAADDVLARMRSLARASF